MLDEHGNMDEALLVKFLLGETGEQESLRVKVWLESSAENRQHLEALQKVWTKTGASSLRVDTDAAWQKLSARIEDFEKTETKEPVIRKLEQRPQWTWAAAAAVVALVGLFGLFQYYFNPGEVKVATQDHLLEKDLPDGTSVALNAHSKLSYPKEFEGDIRKVQLRGEAFFKVTHNAEKPFVIDAGEGIIKVLGTSFNVEAYHHQDLKVHVVTGRVQLSRPGSSVDSSIVILEAGSTGIIETSTGRVYMEKPQYEDALFWLYKKLEFNKTPLPKVLEVLAKNYGVHFSAYDGAINHCLLTARFENESIESILDVISATFDIRFDIRNEMVKVTTQDNNCVQG